MKALEARMAPSGRDGEISHQYTDFFRNRHGPGLKQGIRVFLEDEPYHTSITALWFPVHFTILPD